MNDNTPYVRRVSVALVKVGSQEVCVGVDDDIVLVHRDDLFNAMDAIRRHLAEPWLLDGDLDNMFDDCSAVEQGATVLATLAAALCAHKHRVERQWQDLDPQTRSDLLDQLGASPYVRLPYEEVHHAIDFLTRTMDRRLEGYEPRVGEFALLGQDAQTVVHLCAVLTAYQNDVLRPRVDAAQAPQEPPAA